MAKIPIKTDPGGMRVILTEMAWPFIEGHTEAIAAQASASSGLPADARMYRTDRAHGVVMINHPKGAQAEAKGGHLRRAATARGLRMGD